MFSNQHTNVRDGNREPNNCNLYGFRPDDYSPTNFLLIYMKHRLSLMPLICHCL